VVERTIKPAELEGFEQCWLTGTAAEVTPVGQIGDYNFEVGTITQEIAGPGIEPKILSGDFVVWLCSACLSAHRHSSHTR